MSAFSDALAAPLRRRVVLVVVPLTLVGLAAGREPGDLPEPLPVRRADLILSVEVEGELQAVRSAEIGAPPVPEWEFKIARMAPEGMEIAKGDPVLAFDTEKLQRLLEQKRAELQEAQGKLEQKAAESRMGTLKIDQQIAKAEAEAGKARLKAEAPAELLGRVELEKARLEHESFTQDLANQQAEREAILARADAERRSLVAQRDRARGRVAELQSAIERMTVRAPLGGLVLHRSDWRDEKKKVGDQIWRGEIVLSIPDLSEMRADAMVDEADGGRVAVGQPATLRLEARPDLDYHGRVRRVAQNVRRKSWRVPAKVFRVDVELERTDPAIMRPAMRFRGEIETGRLEKRLLVPREAVFLRESGPVAFAWQFLRWRERPLKLGASNAAFVEVVEGLREGELVLPADLAPPWPAVGAPRGVGP